jgi:Ras family protein T1
MREIDIFNLGDKLTEPELMCDVVCLVYDLNNPRSFEYVARTYLKHFNDCKLPILVLGSKSDQIIVRQQYTLQPDEFCAKYKLPKNHLFSANQANRVPPEVYVKLGTMAAYPNLRRLVHVLLMRPSGSWSVSFSQNLNALQRCLPESVTLVRAGVGLASLAIAGLFIVRLLRAANMQPNPR